VDLVERDTLLAALESRLQGVAVSGHVMLVAGEAGVGKSSLLRELARRHAASGGGVWWGACDALGTPHPLAPLFDIARDTRPRFAAAMAGPRPALFDAVLDELRHAPGPLLWVVEDTHWADDATLDLLTFVGRRIERTRALLAVSYRDDEVGATHPLRRVLGELPAGARSLVPVPRLTAAAVQTLAARAGRRADGVFEATQGNAFFVTEVLRDEAAPTAVPHSVRDVVLARYARLPERVQALLSAVAVVPGRAERWLVDALVAPSLDELEAALASGLLVADGDFLAYRHELGRVAVESALSAPAAQAWHARLLTALVAREGTAPARLVHHAVRAGDGAAVARHGTLAAEEAQRRGAHREHHAQRVAVLRHGATCDAAELEARLWGYASAAGPVGDLQGHLQALQQLTAMALARGDRNAAAVARARQASPLVGLLRHDQARAATQDAMAMLHGALSPAHADVWAQHSWQLMLDRDCADSIARGRVAIALAEALGDRTVAERAQTCTGGALLFVDFDAGVRLLQDLRERRRRRGDGFAEAQTLQMLGSGAGELMALDLAETCLRSCIALCEPQDWNDTYGRAWLALCAVLRGRWSEAAALAQEAIEASTSSDMTRLMAWLALARMRLRRGDPGVADALARAQALAAHSGTLQRLAPAACLQAEVAWAQGDAAAVVAAVTPVLPLAQAKRHPWFVGEMAWWLQRAGHSPDPLPQPLALPYALQLAGRWREAADAWAALGCPFEQARALADGDAQARREALTLAESVGALPLAERLRRDLLRAGVRGLPRGPRAGTEAHPAGLTVAEQRVLALMGAGLRNADIAERLHRSVRTVDHQVAAVLAKLGANGRAEAVDRARREGWLDPRPAAARGAI
jgi:DNA-binding CsgD family transcriptional regulator